MKIQYLFLFAALQLTAAAHSRRDRFQHRRQTNTATPPGSGLPPPGSPAPPAPPVASQSPPPPPPPPPPSPAPTQPGNPEPPVQNPTPPANPQQPTPTSENAASSGTQSVSSTTINTGPPPAATGTEIPPIESITSGMPTKPALLPTSTYTAGAKPPVSGVPVLPTPFVFVKEEWPAWDRVPPTDSPEVQTWMKELEGVDIPDWSPTTNGSCGESPGPAAEAAARGWWTCGGHVRGTDVVSCPQKNTWGVSFDDGPSGYTQYLLDYLDRSNLHATFFVVGSRVVERPAVLVEEYMKGHEISVHTWSHRPLTSLTTEQVVAELGWTRKAIKSVLGVTPTTMRPPYGDIDDRVRAITLAMGMVPIMWTRTPSGGVFDTEDWKVAGGIVNGSSSYKTFETILSNATTAMETGFIVLQHDLYEITVDMAMGFTIPLALSYNPPLTLQPIGQCIRKPTSDLYLESNTNKTFPYPEKVTGGIDTDGDGTIDTKSGDGGKTAQEVKSSTPDQSGSATSPSSHIAVAVISSLLMGLGAFLL